MEFFKVKGFIGRARKSKAEKDPSFENEPLPSEGPKDANLDPVQKATIEEEEEEDDDDDDDDFITNEVKRRLKDLRKNSFMVIIPEESCLEEETSSSEWRGSEVEEGHTLCGIDALYNDYSERMLFFDKMSAQHLKEAADRIGSCTASNQPPRSKSKTLASTLRSMSFKKREELHDECQKLHQSHDEDPCQSIETAYVAHICLTWEALHCQYMRLSQKFRSQPEDPTSYCYAVQAFQQFQVLVQRFIENEPFEQGSRVEVYARARNSLPMLLHVPTFQGIDEKQNEEDYFDPPILASDLSSIMEESILTFHLFLKMDKKSSSSALHLFRGQNQQASNSLLQVRLSLDKKIRVKELLKKRGWKKKSWPSDPEDVELLVSLIDTEIVARMLRMGSISKEQLLWCEEKMSKLDLSENKLQRNGSPILFPC